MKKRKRAIPSNGDIKLLQGNEACVHGALLAGVTFFAGYPITPSTEIAELMARELPRRGGVFVQMEDEIASMGAVIGASLAGAKAMTATSGPGFSLKQENLGFASFTEIPCVVVDVMRGGPSTGLPTSVGQGDIMQSRWGTHGDHPIIVLVPCSVEETLHLTITAFNFSEKYRTPVILLLDEVIGHMREKAKIPSKADIKVVERKRPDVPAHAYQPYEMTADLVPPLADFGSGYRYHVTGLTHDQWGFPTMRLDETKSLLTRLKDKIETNRPDICLSEEYLCKDAEHILVATGSAARSCKAAVDAARSMGIKAGLIRPITLWPHPRRLLLHYASSAKRFVVVELNLGQMVLEVERIVAGKTAVESFTRYDGELVTPEEIVSHLAEEE
ncbi:MAG: 2-oxoacid:acceptor oxidoreductase subunit alpha [Candidatus Abyssobacteria bacterium SURF_17]|uniref:2-oxoacid:acceptor oxidoreductase subunit alpha n=1 Tax=Candidatus Abyssobacteria bacterium SURF_17 TaxID=2093361 RepID=A0A419F666_9BACT|nr:MAG: 2-oxoacid:acceptor oxidoreductase subunit alpha [Candidatus Abyssubacteria bacterium SURF_17]